MVNFIEFPEILVNECYTMDEPSIFNGSLKTGVDDSTIANDRHNKKRKKKKKLYV